MNMRALFFLVALLLACGHTRTERVQAGEEEGLFETHPPPIQKRAALWQALFNALDLRLKAGQLHEEELLLLSADLEKAWQQEKAALPEALHARAEALLEKLHAQASPQEAFRWPVWPVEFSSAFGYRIHPLTGERHFHQGVDLKTTAREEVRSTQAGWVLHAGWAGGYGHMVEVLHPGQYFSRYAHLSQVKVQVGQKVWAGTVLGLAGDSGNATGVHLHFELWKEGRPINPALHLPWVQTEWP